MTSRQLKVLALVPFPLGRAPAQRYRIEQWAPHLELQGISVRFAPFLDMKTANLLSAPGRSVAKAAGLIFSAVRHMGHLAAVRDADVLFVAREAAIIGGPWLETLSARRRPMVYDFDDAIWLPQEASLHSRWAWLKGTDKTRQLCSRAQHVTVGNEFLADYARQWNSAITVIPSTVDENLYSPAKEHRPSARLTVGWMGSHSTAAYLTPILPVLARLQAKMKFRVLVVGASLPAYPGLELECRAWTSEREVDDLREMDVGIMPLPDSEWTRGKCSMKAIQYLGIGVPAIASPVGMNPTVVMPDETGLLASSPDEWEVALRTLLEDLPLRSRLGAGGREIVRSRFSARVQSARMADVFLQTAS